VIQWPPKGGVLTDRAYSLDESYERPWADASEEELGERCNLRGEPSTIALDAGVIACGGLGFGKSLNRCL